MKKVGGTTPKQLSCVMEKANEINKVLDSISEIAMNENETECKNKLDAIKNIINKSHNTRSMGEICKVIEGGKPKSKSKTKKKNYKKKTRKRRKNKRRKTHKKKK